MVSKVVAQQMLFQVKCRGEMQTEQFWQPWQLVSAWFDACDMFFLPQDGTKWWPQHCEGENEFDTLQDVSLRKFSWSADARMIANILKVASCVRKADSDWFNCSAESQREEHVCNCLFRGTGHQCFLPFKIWWGQCSLNVSIDSSRYVWENQQRQRFLVTWRFRTSYPQADVVNFGLPATPRERLWLSFRKPCACGVSWWLLQHT